MPSQGKPGRASSGGVSTGARTPSFAALDFETGDSGRDSACAIGVVRADGDRITVRTVRLIRPPRREMPHAWLHGITWERVRHEPSFREVWREVAPLLEGVDFLAAHNASFERSVLAACCDAAQLVAPPQRFECTVRLARRTWNLYPTRLPDVCRHLGLRLSHHDPLSDAEACASIVIAALADGAELPTDPSARRASRKAPGRPPQ